MNRLISLLIFLGFSQICVGQTTKNKFLDSTSIDFLTQILSLKETFLDEEIEPKKIILYSKPIAWSKYSFSIPDSIIPKSGKEKEKFYHGEMGPYVRHYVFKNEILNANLTSQDKLYMKSQAETVDSSDWKISSEKIIFTHQLENKKFAKRYAFTRPAFSTGFNLAVIEKLIYHRTKDCFRDCELGTVSETDFFYKKNDQGKWIFLGSGPTW